jgi:hypothetical protein
VNLLNGPALTIAKNYLPVAQADQCGKVTYGIPQTGDEDQFIGRGDWVQSSKHTLYTADTSWRNTRIRRCTTARIF